MTLEVEQREQVASSVEHVVGAAAAVRRGDYARAKMLIETERSVTDATWVAYDEIHALDVFGRAW